MGMTAILINGPWLFEQIFNASNRRLHTKKIGLGVTEEKSFKDVDWRTTDGKWSQ